MNPHDLLWGLYPHHLPVEAPGWVSEAVARGLPVVVRRHYLGPNRVAVGIRGARREQRFACSLPLAAVTRRVTPEQLIDLAFEPHCPALHALLRVRDGLTANGWVWGVSGSAGFELASGVRALHAQSDLDLIVRAPKALSKREARALLATFEGVGCAVDVQLQTPWGGVALREWASDTRTVLLKSERTAQLVADPWAVAMEPAL